MFNDEEYGWIALGKRGWIAAPFETNEAFLQRRKAFFSGKDGFVVEGVPLSVEECEKAHLMTESVYGFRLEDVPVFIGTARLLPWQGALLWAYKGADGQEFPVIQIGENRGKGKGFFSYDREEMLSHELVHAARFAFKEPFFEEILAYKTSKNRYRRFFGPLFLFPFEPLILFFLICLSIVGSLLLSPDAVFSLICVWTPSALFSLLLLRLCFLQAVFSSAYRRLSGIVKSSPLPLLFRLSDREIMATAFRFPHKTKEFFLQKSKENERYAALLRAYFS